MTNLTNKLAMNTKTTHHVDWLTYSWVRDKGMVGLDEICKEVYGKAIDMGSPNDTDYSCSVKKDNPDIDNEADAEEIDLIVANGFFEDWQLNLVMSDLCRRGAIPEGNYVVTMSW